VSEDETAQKFKVLMEVAGGIVPKYADQSELVGKLLDQALADIIQLMNKNQAYGSSWKRRGGVGAFMMAARKWDRLEEIMKGVGYDVFVSDVKDIGGETVRDQVGDLRRYLMLIETELKG